MAVAVSMAVLVTASHRLRVRRMEQKISGTAARGRGVAVQEGETASETEARNATDERKWKWKCTSRKFCGSPAMASAKCSTRCAVRAPTAPKKNQQGTRARSRALQKAIPGGWGALECARVLCAYACVRAP